MKIKLVGGRTADIDISDYYKVSGYNWCIVDGRRTTNIYAGAYVSRKLIYMHRLIRQPPDNMEIDHVDGNGLNNRWTNLRIVTRSENAINKYYPVGESDYIGVYRSGNRWAAKTSKDGKQYYAGTFDTEEEAAHARDALALRIQGSFAKLNFPDLTCKE